MKRITHDNAHDLANELEEAAGYFSDLASAIGEWACAKDAGGEEGREDARMARDEIETASEQIADALVALGFIKAPRP